MLTSSIRFDLTTDLYPDDYPTALNIYENTPMSLSSFRELIEQAQATHTPCYSLAVVCSGNTEKDRFYQIYDSSFFKTYLHNKKPEGLTESRVNDPITGKTIKKINYFVLNCFKFNFFGNDPGLFQAVNLDNEELTFKLLKIRDEERCDFFHNSLNSNILSSDIFEAKDKLLVRRCQRVIAQWITKTNLLDAIISSEDERVEQSIIWNWCCSHSTT